ncbi:MAG: biotin transporter BioY [Propioniciclava sp.]
MAESRRFTMGDLALVAVFAGVIAAFTMVPAVPVGPLGVPITLQTLAVALAGLLLGPWRGFLAVTLYLLLGFAGLPVFAQGFAGLGVLFQPSAGYLLAFPLGALTTGWLALRAVTWSPSRTARTLALVGAAIVGSILVVHSFGILGLTVNAGLSIGQAVAADLIYLPGDLIKCVLAAVVAVTVHRAIPTLLARPRLVAAEVSVST